LSIVVSLATRLKIKPLVKGFVSFTAAMAVVCIHEGKDPYAVAVTAIVALVVVVVVRHDDGLFGETY